MMDLAKTAGLFALTALAEIVGCYLPWLVLKQAAIPFTATNARVSPVSARSVPRRHGLRQPL